MKKTYKIDVDCANCANKMEDAAKNTAGVKNATVNFMTLKMIVEFEDGQEPATVELLSQAGLSEPEQRLVVLAPALDGESAAPQAVLEEMT